MISRAPARPRPSGILAHLSPGAAVLDVGCGPRMHALKAAARICRVAE